MLPGPHVSVDRMIGEKILQIPGEAGEWPAPTWTCEDGCLGTGLWDAFCKRCRPSHGNPEAGGNACHSQHPGRVRVSDSPPNYRSLARRRDSCRYLRPTVLFPARATAIGAHMELHITLFITVFLTRVCFGGIRGMQQWSGLGWSSDCRVGNFALSRPQSNTRAEIQPRESQYNSNVGETPEQAKCHRLQLVTPSPSAAASDLRRPASTIRSVTSPPPNQTSGRALEESRRRGGCQGLSSAKGTDWPTALKCISAGHGKPYFFDADCINHSLAPERHIVGSARVAGILLQH